MKYLLLLLICISAYSQPVPEENNRLSNGWIVDNIVDGIHQYTREKFALIIEHNEIHPSINRTSVVDTDNRVLTCDYIAGTRSIIFVFADEQCKEY